jgi:hypothetical protein
MEVLHRQDEGLAATDVLHHLVQGCKGPGLPCLGAELHERGRLERYPQELQQHGQGLLRGQPSLLERVVDRARNDLRAVGLMNATGLSHQIADGHIGGPLFIGEAVPLIVRHRLPPQTLAELIEQTRLPHARVTHNADHLALSLDHVLQAGMQQRQFPLAAHKAAQDTRPVSGHTGTPLLESPYRVDRRGRRCSRTVEGA